MPPSSSSSDWIARELSRLEKTKADKSYVVQIEKIFEARQGAVDRELEEARLSFGRDISNVKKEVDAAKALAEKHPCVQAEEFAEMNATLAKLSEAHENMLASQKTLADSQTFWSRWLVKGLIGFIGFLVLTGGAWVYSYFSIQNKAAEAQKASAEVKTLVTDVQQTQKNQAEALKQISTVQGGQSAVNLHQELKKALKEVLADEAANR